MIFFYFFFYIFFWMYLFWYWLDPFAAIFWPRYVIHLIEQQRKVVFNRIPLEDLLSQELDQEKKEKYKTILEVRNFAKKLYQLENSYTFSHFVDLNRDTLGWNLTATPEFSLEAKTWEFPFIGKFGYLGFFNYELALEKAEELKQNNLDVYLSEISGYSTLGIFPDPVFNVYLTYPQTYLVRLVLHELAHEKLYFRDDSFFSEALASFIEKEATKRFFALKGKKITNDHPKYQREYQEFISLLEKTKEELSKIYESSIAQDKKRQLKKEILAKLQRDLRSLEKNFSHVAQARYLASLPDLNNAILLQFRRYSHHYESFSWLLEEVHGDIPLWFGKLSLLKKCRKARQEFLEKKISVEEALLSCPN